MFKNHIYFDENPNGKLFNECFNDLRLDGDKLKLGAEYEVFLQEQYMGRAVIVGLKQFTYQHLTDVMTLLTTGDSLPMYVAKLKQQHPEQELEWNTPLYHIILKWVMRDHDNQAAFLHKYWTAVYNHAANQQTTAV